MKNKITIEGKITDEKFLFNEQKKQLIFYIQNVVISKKTKKKRILYIKCIAFDNLATYIINNFKCGDMIIIDGRLSIDKNNYSEIILQNCNIK